jgi:hypothetical protein
MPQASTVSTDRIAEVLARLPRGLDLDLLARETGAIQRPRELRCGSDLLRLALAWGPGGMSLAQTAAWANALGFVHFTDEALIVRLHNSVAFLQGITQALLEAVASVPRWSGRLLRIADSTSLCGPASKGTDWRIHGVFDLARGGFSALQITDRHGAEALDRGEPVAGEIRIADRGYANAPAWQRFCEAARGQADFIVRMRWNTVRLVDAHAKRFDLIGWLQQLTPAIATHEQVVWVQSARRQTPRPIRLIARRKTPQAIAAAHQQLRQHASRKQSVPDPRSFIAAEFLVLATTLPQDGFPAAEVLAVYRLRWQIELAFKRLKSQLNIDRLPTRTENGTRCWLSAHLIMALLCDNLTQDFLESFP